MRVAQLGANADCLKCSGSEERHVVQMEPVRAECSAFSMLSCRAERAQSEQRADFFCPRGRQPAAADCRALALRAS